MTTRQLTLEPLELEPAGLPNQAAFWPFASVIVPCRNEEKHIATCLESIFSNDYPKDRFEILVVDGMSEDRTREIVLEYAKRYEQVRLVDNPQTANP